MTPENSTLFGVSMSRRIVIHVDKSDKNGTSVTTGVDSTTRSPRPIHLGLLGLCKLMQS